MKKIIITAMIVALFLISSIQSLAQIQEKIFVDTENYFASGQIIYKKERQLDFSITDNTIINSIFNDGLLLWSYEDSTYYFSDFSICENGSYGIAGGVGYSSSCFQLFKIQGNGTPDWTYINQHEMPWAQVDSSKESDTLVGLVASDFSIPAENASKRLYKWDLTNNEPCWFFDIPDELHVFNGGFVEDNIAVSDNGRKIILGTSDFENQTMKIFIFNSDSNIPVSIIPIEFDYPYVLYNLLDVSYDGSFILFANDREAIVIDTTIPAIRWRGDPDGVGSNDDICVASMSGDGSILIGHYWNSGHWLKALKWNESESDYEVLWDQFVLPHGWLYSINLHTLDVSYDGSTVMHSFTSFDFLETKLVTYDINNGTLLWEDHVIVEGEYPVDILDICLSKDGLKAIVAHADDEFGMNPQVKVYERTNSTPIFTLYTSATAISVDISPYGNLAIAGGDLYPSNYLTYGTALYSIQPIVIYNNGPGIPTIYGRENGNINIEYTYTSNTTDPEGDQVYYWFDWDDGTNTGWLGPYNSDIQISANHSWSQKGTYNIKVKAKDIFGAESDWGTMSVVMPRNLLFYLLITKLLEKFPNAFPILRRIFGL